MEYLFNVAEWGKLTALQRIECCRSLAERTRALSKTATDEEKCAYLYLAEHWDRLGKELSKPAHETTCCSERAA